jgi:hypothetical protein
MGDQVHIAMNAHLGPPLPKSQGLLVDASVFLHEMHTPKPIIAAQYLNQRAPLQMPELISVMSASKYPKWDYPFESELIHQR